MRAQQNQGHCYEILMRMDWARFTGIEYICQQKKCRVVIFKTQSDKYKQIIHIFFCMVVKEH